MISDDLANNGNTRGPDFVGPNAPQPISYSAFDNTALNIIPCAIYVRVSTDEQAKEEHFSLPAQEEYCMGEIRKRQAEGWVHRITISDEGYGGALFERPGLLKLLNMVKAGEIKAVIVYKRDRIFRKMEISAAVQAIFDQYGVRILSYSEGMCDSNPQAVWMGQMIDANSQLERANIRTRILDARRHAAKSGIWQGGSAAYGYHYEKGSMIPPSLNESEAKVVRFIFEQAAGGIPPNEIAKELRRLQIYGRPRKQRISGR